MKRTIKIKYGKTSKEKTTKNRKFLGKCMKRKNMRK